MKETKSILTATDDKSVLPVYHFVIREDAGTGHLRAQTESQRQRRRMKLLIDWSEN